jgi:hypothetical protein
MAFLQKMQNMNVKGFFKSIIDSEAVTSVTGTVRKGFNTAGNIIESGGHILATPGNWIKAVQKNWFTYVVVATIILICIVFLYCSLCYYMNRRTTNAFSSNLIELATVISNKNKDPKPKQEQQELSVNNLSNILKA